MNGKGSRQRKRLVKAEEWSANWDTVFGPKDQDQDDVVSIDAKKSPLVDDLGESDPGLRHPSEQKQDKQ